MSPTVFTEPTVITTGWWRSQLLDVSLGSFTSDYNGYWGELKFRYEGGDENSAVKVDILDSNNNVLLSDLTLSELDGYKKVDLSIYSSVRNVDIKVQIRLSAVTISPIIDDITISFKDTENS